MNIRDGKGKPPSSEKSTVTARTKRRRWFYFGAALFAGLVLALAYWWFFKRGRISTEDAYVHADSATIASRIDGTVVKVLVENDQPVQAGDTLVELDKADDQAAVDRAAAALSSVTAQARAAEITLAVTDSQTKAGLEAAQASLQQAKDQEKSSSHALEELQKKLSASQAALTYAETEYKRYEALSKKNIVSKQQVDKARTDLKEAQANLNALQAQIQAAQADVKAAQQVVAQARAKAQSAQANREQVKVQQHHVGALKAQVKQARAELVQARLSLSYTTIAAPIAGHVAQKNVQMGDRVTAGQPFMSIVPLHAIYVEANFKETDLAPVRIGLPAEIKADIYPGHTYQGRVVGIAAGTGAAFSLLPPENATGNWIKVVRRVPVRVAFTSPIPPQYPLRVGLTVTVTIHVRQPDEGPRMEPTALRPENE